MSDRLIYNMIMETFGGWPHRPRKNRPDAKEDAWYILAREYFIKPVYYGEDTCVRGMTKEEFEKLGDIYE